MRRILPASAHHHGVLCPRGARAAQILDSPDRLLHPRLRAADGSWRRAGWEEAYDFWVDRIRDIAARHGPSAVATYSGRGNFDRGLNDAFAPAGTAESCASAVLFPFGSASTTGVGSLCYAAYGMIAPKASFGAPMRAMRADLAHADLVLVWGTNPAVSAPPVWRGLRAAARRGARVIVVDHRRTETARGCKADWVGVRPGTDGALALGLAQVILDEGLEDREFARRWTHGLGDYARYAQGFDPVRVADITGVPPDRIRALAREIASTSRCCLLTYTGLEYSNSGVQAVRAVWAVHALTGHLDAPGGNLFRMAGEPAPRRVLEAPRPDAPRPFGADVHPAFHDARREGHAALLPKAILEGDPYPVRALVIAGSSAITAWPDPALWRRALAALDLLVVVDMFPTADMEFAHLALPAASAFETESYIVRDEEDAVHVQLRRPVRAPAGESRGDYRIFAELAARLGYPAIWAPDEAGMVEHAVQGFGLDRAALREHPEGITVPAPPMRYRKYATGDLRADGRPGFETPSGRFELDSLWLRGHGYPGLPVYTEPREGPRSGEAPGGFPLVLNSGSRTHHVFRSQHHNIPGLCAREPAPRVHLHADDAAARGIEDGDPVTLRTPRGEAPFMARVDRDIVPGAVEAEMGGGGPLGPAAWREGNVNALTDLDNRDPISGFPVYRALLCEVAPRAGGRADRD